MARFKFDLLSSSSSTQARRGRLTLRHGTVETPVFMPVGTLAAVKALDPRDLRDVGAQIILGNAYPLMLRPGTQLVTAHGGMHDFMGWDGCILTDSGGYQVFSLADLRRIDDDAVEFRSHVDGALVRLSPEKLVEVQEALAPDIAMVLDECPPGDAGREAVAAAVERTTAWAERCLAARRRDDLAWFGIVQGGVFDDLRTQHAAVMAEKPFDGFAIGGVSVGEDAQAIESIVRHTAPQLPSDKPRYLMGVGTPADLVRGVAAGIDMFDCVMPTRHARTGQLFTSKGRVVIKNAQHRDSMEPVDADCSCSTCQTYTRAYVRHLFVTGEIGYHRLATLHNVAFYLRLMKDLRREIEQDRFNPAEWLSRLA